MKLKHLNLFFLLLFLAGCNHKELTFEEVIAQDVTSQLGLGICKDIPAGAKIEDIVIGDVTPIENLDLVGVSVSFNYSYRDKKSAYTTSLLYSNHGKQKKLEAIEGCRLNNED